MNGVTTSRRPLKQMVFELTILNPPPPLVLLINPSNFDMKYTPKISEQRVRWSSSSSQDVTQSTGYVFHAHHDELDVITASGKSAMFMSPGEGLTVKNRLSSTGFLNIEKLVAIYRNNGMNFNSKPDSYIRPAKIDSIGRVVIIYDGFVYKGHFTSFNYNQNDVQQFNVNFSFDFKVTQTLDMTLLAQNQVLKNNKTFHF